MKKYLKYPLIGIIIFFLVFGVYIASILYGTFVYLNDFEKEKLEKYNRHYQENYSKTQTPENLFALFKQRMLNKDKEGVKTISVPAFSSLPKEIKDKDFEDFYNFYAKHSFEKAEFEVEYDTAYYFEIRNVLENSQPTKQKIYFSRQSMYHVKGKFNRFPISDYYLLEAKISK